MEAIVESASSASSSSPPIAAGRKRLPLCYPHCCGKPVFHGNHEALAWGLDQMGRAIAYIGVAVFLGTALLKLATKAAGCSIDPLPGTDDIPTCENRTHGVRPSSLLTTYAAVVSILSSLVMPLMGAIIDFTPHRRLLGRVLTALYVMSLFPTIFVNQHTWFAVTIIQFVGVFIGWGQASIAYAYLPDLTNDEAVLTGYTRAFTVLIFSSVVVYLAITVGFAWAFGFDDDNIKMAQFGMSIAFVMSIITEAWSWWGLFETRPAARALPPNKTLWTAGFEQVYRTSRSIVNQYSALMWFFLSHSMSESAIMSLSTIAITFFTEQLHMSATQNGVAAFVMLVASIPGAFLSEWCTNRFNPIRSSIVALLLLIGTTIVVALVLHGPDTFVLTCFLSGCWGIAIGWKLTADEVVAASIIPEGQDAEIMGFYLFSGEVFGWLPPLVFTVLNEAGLPQQYGVGCLCVFWILSVVALVLFGDYNEARERANRIKASTTATGDVEVRKMIAQTEEGSNIVVAGEDDDDDEEEKDELALREEIIVSNNEESSKMLSPRSASNSRSNSPKTGSV